MKRINLFHGILLLFVAGFFSSCSQEERNEMPESKTTVAELTTRLKAYNTSIGVTVPADDDTRAFPKVTFTNKDKIKIAIADVKGALRGGATGGVPGALLGAAVQSLIKAAKMYAWKQLTATLKSSYCNGLVFGTNGVAAFTDSIGYYHNILEAEMYRQDSLSHQTSTVVLMRRANSIMRNSSRGYILYGPMMLNNLERMAATAKTINDINDEELSFDEYCARLKVMHPADAAYLDFAAEYLYAAFYGNVDLQEYTEQVLFIINNSNAGVEDARLLNYCIQVAHASVIYNNNTETTSNQ